MANNTVYQVMHFLCILAHIGMIAAGIVTFVINGSDSDPSNESHVTYPWAVGGIVSHFRTISRNNAIRAPKHLDASWMRMNVLRTFATGYGRLWLEWDSLLALAAGFQITGRRDAK